MGYGSQLFFYLLINIKISKMKIEYLVFREWENSSATLYNECKQKTFYHSYDKHFFRESGWSWGGGPLSVKK